MTEVIVWAMLMPPVVAQAPKLSPHISRMVSILTPVLHIQPADLNIKATTTEAWALPARARVLLPTPWCWWKKFP